MSKTALIALKAKIQKQIDENTSDYWWNMCGAALQADIELIDAMLAEEVA